MAREGVAVNLIVRGVPYGRTAAEYDDLWGLVRNAGSRGYSLRERAFGENVHEEGDNFGFPAENGFDLIQGRQAGGSGWAVFVEEGDIGREEVRDVFLAHDWLHQFCSPAG